MKTLLIGELHEEALKLLEEQTNLKKSNEINDSYLEIEAVVLRTFTKFGSEELKKLPSLKYVVSCSVGTDNLDLNALKENNIELIHCPGSNANSVAEHALYLILALIRSEKKPFFEIKNKTIGIIGFGHVGKLVAKKLQGFEVKVIACDVIEQDPEILQKLNVKMLPINELASQSDILTVHVPLNKQTHHLINDNLFSKMKNNSFFINTSRAEVIDENALSKHANKFRGVGLDVCSDGLNLKGHTILTNHCAAQGEESLKEMCLKPVKEFLKQVN
jgi:lactate dehydrogenase-like 2-hydroxyacid dehydrogenase